MRFRLKNGLKELFGESDFFPLTIHVGFDGAPMSHPRELNLRRRRKSLTPSFPPQFRAGGPRSRVVISGIIGTDGQWHNVEAVKSEGSIVDSFWIGLMHQRHDLRPLGGGETPVEYEMMIEFDIPLRPLQATQSSQVS